MNQAQFEDLQAEIALEKDREVRQTMAHYKGNQSLLDAVLGEFKDLGFELKEADDITADLYFKDKKIASYNSTKLTIPILHEGCRNFINNTMRAL